ncbi:hypothetical protein [Nonomuraea aridisoli]|uniref:Uncharacterized protein n=1 Tax=Nonomuraea aridisoli TaxID=2070368 RepID=A0A2W2E3V4_9ACTN|nr:hypothetical protein [Nonomuraea aridisoli]PZG08230.1 hypothetical protein C1J01_39375 [Nonomuraea aridisoli]
MTGPSGLVGDYRIDAALTEYGGALSPDGRTLALVTADLKLVTLDARTGRVGKRRTDVGDYEVIRVERWIGRDEVLVRRWDDDYVLLTKVHVRTGATEELDAELGESLGYDSRWARSAPETRQGS